MNNKILLAAAALIITSQSGLMAQDLFESGKLQDKTLRLDLAFSGDCNDTYISLEELSYTDGWYGRRHNMKSLPVHGNGRVLMTDKATGDTLYYHSFCSLFEEWQATPEAKRVRKSFQNVFQVPMPSGIATINITLNNSHNVDVASFSFDVDPTDILIRPRKQDPKVQTKYVWKGGDPKDCIDIAIVSEGYTAGEMETFYDDARRVAEAVLSYEPFKSLKDRFNFVAVAVPSNESGISMPGKDLWYDTALSSNYWTFYSDRYLSTLHLKALNDALTGVPYEHILIAANTYNYGVGGVYNSYTMASAHHPTFVPVVVHEFGHAFAGLADEYDYSDGQTFYFPDVEPWEQNITTKADFASKWQDMIDAGEPVGLVEGAGYQQTGVWRPTKDCRMRTNEFPTFCPVCHRAIDRVIRFYTEER